MSTIPTLALASAAPAPQHRVGGIASWLLRPVVAACPIKDPGRPAIWQRLNVGSTHVTVLLAIGHDDTEFICIVLDRVLTTVHWAAV